MFTKEIVKEIEEKKKKLFPELSEPLNNWL